MFRNDSFVLLLKISQDLYIAYSLESRRISQTELHSATIKVDDGNF